MEQTRIIIKRYNYYHFEERKKIIVYTNRSITNTEMSQSFPVKMSQSFHIKFNTSFQFNRKGAIY
jgi:hypothetical protein